MSAATEAAIIKAQRLWSLCIDVEFVRGGDDIVFYESDAFAPHSMAIVGLPSAVWLTSDSWGKIWPGHEIGHSLGLLHPHEVGRPELTMKDAVLSYVWEPYNYTLGKWMVPLGPMRWEMEQLTPVYGRSHAMDGDSVHRPAPNELSSLFDWDGVDVLDLGACNGGIFDPSNGGWLRHASGGMTWVGGEMEVIKLSRGADTLILQPDDLIIGLTKADRLITADDTAERLTGRELKAEGLTGRHFELGGAIIQWTGTGAGLEKLVLDALP